MLIGGFSSVPANCAVRLWRVLSFASALVASCFASAGAQGIDCGRLQAQIASAGRGNPGQAARYASAANKQQAEIARTGAYAQSIGCNNKQFLFFGSAPPAQCGGINARLQQMRGNVASLQAQANAANSDGQRRDLQARYDSYCRGGQPIASRSLFDSLFGNGHDRFNDRVKVPIDEPREPLRRRIDDDDERTASVSSGSQAMCVRTCDGGFFPVSYSARRANLDDLEDLCKALCPNTEVSLYTHAASRDINAATATDGTPYSSLKNAGKYRTKFDPACTCKPPDRSWVEALAAAEDLLDKRKTDIIVTPEKSEELLRGKQNPALRDKAGPVAAVGDSNAPPAVRGDGLRREAPVIAGPRKPVRVIDPNLN